MPRATRAPAQWEPSATGCARCGRREVPDTKKRRHQRLVATSEHRYCHTCLMQMKQRLRLMVDNLDRKAARLRRVYNLTLTDYGRYFDAQRGVCAICRDREKAILLHDQATGLVVDHDHDSGEVRGLLCARCNSGIGLLGDDPRNLDAAAEYLRRTKSKQAAS